MVVFPLTQAITFIPLGRKCCSDSWALPRTFRFACCFPSRVAVVALVYQIALDSAGKRSASPGTENPRNRDQPAPREEKGWGRPSPLPGREDSCLIGTFRGPSLITEREAQSDPRRSPEPMEQVRTGVRAGAEPHVPQFGRRETGVDQLGPVARPLDGPVAQRGKLAAMCSFPDAAQRQSCARSTRLARSGLPSTYRQSNKK